MEDERLNERTAMLKRLYWLDRLCEIGKSLGIPYFTNVAQYWQLDHEKAAHEIAKSIVDNNELLRVNRQFPPKYFELGGFQGEYYSADEKGQIRIASSRNEIQANVKKALSKHGEKARGLLQALINKGGRSGFFALIPEIEEVIGYEFYPSTLLPKLSAYRLIFKTGSNKYPDWSMPEEIIAPVQEALNKFKQLPSEERKTKERMTESVSDEMLRQARIVGEIADSILQTRRGVNLGFAKEFGFELLKQDELATADMRKPCSNEEDFNNRILALGSLIDRMNIDSLKQRFLEEDSGSITVLEAFLQVNRPNYKKALIMNLRMIKRLRSEVPDS